MSRTYTSFWAKHKRGILTAIGALLLILIVWISYASIVHRTDPGSVGIVVNYGSVIGGKPGITVVPSDQQTAIFPWQPESFVEYSVAQQSLIMSNNPNEGQVQGKDGVTCQDSNGIQITLDATVIWQVEAAKAGLLYTLRPGQALTGDWNNDIESTVVRRYARSAISQACKSSTWDLIGKNEAAIMQQAYTIMAPQLDAYGILVQDNGVLGGEITYSNQQQQQLNQLTQAQLQAQQAQYLQQKAQYEAQAAITAAQGQAKAIAILNAALANNPNYLTYLEISKWDGKLPQVQGNGSGVIFPLK